MPPNYLNIIKKLPIIKFELYNKKEICFLIPKNLSYKILILFKNHFKYQFKILTCISGVDYPENLYRFILVYELLSIKYNLRIRLKILLDDLLPPTSIEKIFLGASWWEYEIWDMFGIFFLTIPI